MKRIKPASGLKPEVNYHEAITQMVADSYAQEFNKACAQAIWGVDFEQSFGVEVFVWCPLVSHVVAIKKPPKQLGQVRPSGRSSSQTGLSSCVSGENSWCFGTVGRFPTREPNSSFFFFGCFASNAQLFGLSVLARSKSWSGTTEVMPSHFA